MKGLIRIGSLLALLAPCQAESVTGVSNVLSSITEEKKDPNLEEMTFDLGYGIEHFEVFMDPDIKAMSQGRHDTVIKPKMKGHAVKFFNMSPKHVQLFWVDDNNNPVAMGKCKPFHSLGTASFPGHKFFFGPTDYAESKVVLQHFIVDKDTDGPQALYYYDPINVPGDEEKTKENLATLTLSEYEKYNKMARNRKFAEEYKHRTGREYLTMYPRPKPVHFMWPADYFGQEHWVATRETHFKSIPHEQLSPIEEVGLERILKEEDPRILSEYREPGLLNMTLKVVSIRPRAYEIDNFLSEVEVDHIVNYAKTTEMHLSTVGQGTDASKAKVRTSYNTWVGRETDQVFDTVYRRAADLLRIDEALFRDRDESEFPHWPNRVTVGEQLQLVHYSERQEYTAHHDFGYAAVDDKLQPARFATLLLYLNDVKEGGETEFPRWINGETPEPLRVKARKCKAALFYSFLPDGNLDDLSQHAARSVMEGEKYLINLWKSVPLQVSTMNALSAGYYHTCAIEYRQGVEVGGGLRCWGQNTHGQTSPPPGVFTQVSSGHLFSCAISIDSKVKCWGNIRGTPNDENSNNERFKSVSSGKAHACALTLSGKIRCWGRNTFGETNPSSSLPLATAAKEQRRSLHQTSSSSAGVYIQVSCGDSLTCGLLQNGQIQCWGKRYNREEIIGERFSQIHTGKKYRICGITESSGDIHCWTTTASSSSSASSSSYSRPREKYAFCDKYEGPFLQVSVGIQETCALRTNHTVQCWGQQRTIIPNKNSTGFDMEYHHVSLGVDHACAIDMNDKLQCWRRGPNLEAHEIPLGFVMRR